MIRCVCCLILATLLGAGEAAATPVIVWYSADPAGMPVAECRIPRQRFAAVGDRIDLVAESVLHLVDQAATGNPALPVLYPVATGRDPEGTDDLVFLFRLPMATPAPAACCVTMVGQRSYLPGKSRMLRMNRQHAADWIAPVTVLDATAGEALQQRWLAAFTRQLQARIALREDHELELLLDWRFNGFRPGQLQAGWKRSPLLRALFAVSGLNDIEDAMPINRDLLLAEAPADRAPPAGIELPPVEAVHIPSFNSSPLADWVPRDCYYLEWPDLGRWRAGLARIAAEFDAWSGRVYGRTAVALLAHHRARLGLTDEWLAAQGDRLAGIAIAGRDIYVQSGTHLLCVLTTTGPVTPPAGIAAAQPAPEVLILATSPQLVADALRCHDDGSNLRLTPQFRDARAKLTTPPGERELGFLYISDHFLANFLSPRWHITADRLVRLDARLRLAHLLRLVAEAETGRPQTLATLAEAGLLPPAEAAWLLRDLEERDGRIVHRELGALHDHPPIDDLPFDRVSEREATAYQEFSNRYIRRWRQMDPIGFTLTRDEAGLWRTRLSVSPISRFSPFREIMPYICREKGSQRLRQLPGTAVGLCLRLDLARLTLDRELPAEKTVSAQLLFTDFATSSFAPATWLAPDRPEDPLSYLRLPAVLLGPREWFHSLIGLIDSSRRIELEPGISALGIGGMDASPLLVLEQTGRPEVALAVNPAPLRVLRDGERVEVADAIPSDLHAFADLAVGYTMRRKLWQLAIRNRTLAAWRRADRGNRITETLGLTADDPRLAALEAAGVFPSGTPAAALDLGLLPRRPESPPPTTRATTSALSDLGRVPMPLRCLERVDLYISIEDNALYFLGEWRPERGTRP